MSLFVSTNTSTRVGTGFYLPFLEIAKIAEEYDYFPIHAEFIIEGLDPSILYEKLNTVSPSCIFESLIGEENGRYSIIAYNSILEITNTSNNCDNQIRSFLRNANIKKLNFSHFTGGFIGVWDYDYTSNICLNQIGNSKEVFGQRFFLPSRVIIYDKKENKLKMFFWFEGSLFNETIFKIAQKEIEDIYDLANLECKSKKEILFNNQHTESELEDNFDCNVSKNQYIGWVNKAKKHIFKGDVFQLVLSRRFSRDSKALPWNVYRILRQLNPSPYMFFIKFSDYTLLGASPETQVKVENKKVLSKPIAGTRKLTENKIQNELVKEELKNDVKERAEHIMLVDLSRNDIGRISETGTVKVGTFMALETYSHVVHMVSSVEGKLKPELDSLDAFNSCFPAGTLTGSPKVKAIELIKQIELEDRGIYGGAVGYIDFNGNLDTCITIRAVLHKKGVYYLQTGAGIVADSVPELEYEETLHKARALMISILKAEKML